MESDPREVATLRSFITRKRGERARYLAERLARARSDFDAIVEMVIRDFRPTALYQWGSLLEGGHFQEISDIDLGVAGVTDPANFFSLCDKAEKLTTFPLHIAQMETMDPVYAEAIIKRGRLVYERPV